MWGAVVRGFGAFEVRVRGFLVFGVRVRGFGVFGVRVRDFGFGLPRVWCVGLPGHRCLESVNLVEVLEPLWGIGFTLSPYPLSLLDPLPAHRTKSSNPNFKMFQNSEPYTTFSCKSCKSLVPQGVVSPWVP